MSGQVDSDTAPQTPLGIICGGGAFPAQVAEAVLRGGRPIFMLGVQGVAEPAIERFPHAWFRLIELRRVRKLLQQIGCREVCIIGHMARPPLGSMTLDRESLRLLPRLAQLYRGGDDRLLTGVAGLIEEVLSLKVLGARDVAPDLLAPAGSFGRHQPSADDHEDIACGIAVLAALGPFDVGQSVVVARRRVLAIESAEGTDAMIARIAALRANGGLDLPRGVGVLIKAPKPRQDLRVDLPAIGPRTVENIVAAGLAGIAVIAEGAIVADAERLIAAADRANVFVFGAPAKRDNTP